MSRRYPNLFITLSFLAGSFLSLAAKDAINFNRDIRPILSNKCFHCHGPDEADRKEELRMDIPDGPLGALTPRDGGGTCTTSSSVPKRQTLRDAIEEERTLRRVWPMLLDASPRTTTT